MFRWGMPVITMDTTTTTTTTAAAVAAAAITARALAVAPRVIQTSGHRFVRAIIRSCSFRRTPWTIPCSLPFCFSSLTNATRKGT